MASFAFLLVTLQAFILASQTHGVCYHNIPLEYGTVKYENTYYIVTCHPGYVLQGQRVVYCVGDNWESPPPGCFKDESGNRRNVAPRENYNYYSSSGVNGEDASPSETVNNPCENLGGCQQICKNDQGRAKCRCRQGYTLASDGKKCIEAPSESDMPRESTRRVIYDIERGNEKRSQDPLCHNYQCAQLCVVEKGLARCGCRKGFILNKEDQRSCDKNLGPPIHPGNPCETNNGGCDHKCNLIRSNKISCSCNQGYYLHGDRKTCIAVQPIPKPVSCYDNNGGCEYYCSIRENSVVCSCPAGYTLNTDWKSCIPSQPIPRPVSCYYNNGGCQHTCSMRGNTVVCSCPPGYRLDTNRKHCIALSRVTCDDNNGGCEYSCTMTRNTAVCSCPRGYTLDRDRKHCVDIDECRHERLNKCHHICENTEGSYTCRCRPGYILMEDKCEGCRKNSYWSTEKNGCINCPANSFTLSDGKVSVRDCICHPGFTGNPGENKPCLDNDECARNNFGCSHTCVNTPGDAFCSCPLGYEVDKDNKTCIDIDECSIKNGGCEGQCFNTDGSFYCKCPSGFTSSNKDQYSCDDVDECSENNGGCEQLCINYRGGHYCTCREGYRLDGSLKSCNDIVCPALPVPHFSTMRCKKDAQVLPEMENYPTGTVCSFKCISGFKDTSESNRMKCQEDGKWEGSLAVCKSQRCPPLSVPENGDVHPSSCSINGNTVKQKCTFTCRQGYRVVGPSVFGCKNNLFWDKPMNDTPVCQPEDIRASMECTRDVTAILEPGQSSQNVTIPEPVTNMESYDVFPEGTVVGKPTEFPAGKTKVVFTASSLSSNRTAKCVTTIHIIDEEPPVFLSCPGDIVVEDARIDGETVMWEVPDVIDNVYVESLTSSMVSNTTFAPGSYVVEYVARDPAGNTESCFFKVNIVRLNCDDLKEPVHGTIVCNDWLYGRLCLPYCNDGYMRDPSEAQLFSCGDSGVWKPSNEISECLPYTETDSSECPDGSEFIYLEETEEEICLECPPSAVWSPTTRKCEKGTS